VTLYAIASDNAQVDSAWIEVRPPSKVLTLQAAQASWSAGSPDFDDIERKQIRKGLHTVRVRPL